MTYNCDLCRVIFINESCYVCGLIMADFNQMKNKKITTLFEQFQNQISESQKEAKSIPLTQIHVRSLSWLGSTGTVVKSGGVNLFLAPAPS